MTNRLILFLFAWGIVGCSASRWRMAGVGVGELMVGLASLLALSRLDFSHNSSPVLRIWLWFVGISTVALLTGTFWAVAIGVWEPIGFAHDALALAFCFGSLTMLLPMLLEDNRRAWFLHQFLRASLTLALVNLVFYGFFQLYVGETTVWIGRFNGLSANPNQLALYVCLIPFLLLQRPWQLSRWETIGGIGICLLVGWLTGSDALLLAWVVGFVGLLVLKINHHLWRSNLAQNTHAKAFLGLFGILFLLGMTVLFRANLSAIYAIGGQGNLRFQRWQNGLMALGHSPLFGLGPGAFSGDESAFGGHEAHNLYIDWMASGGLLAGLVLIWFQRHTWLTISMNRVNVLLAGFISLLVFSCFHYVARHPIFWLFHLLLLLNPPPPCAVYSVR